MFVHVLFCWFYSLPNYLFCYSTFVVVIFIFENMIFIKFSI